MPIKTNQQKCSRGSRYGKGHISTHENLSHSTVLKPKQSLNDIVRQIDKIKYKLTKIKQSEQYVPKPKNVNKSMSNKFDCNASVMKRPQSQFLMSPYSKQIEHDYNGFKSPNKQIKKSSNDFEFERMPHHGQINLTIHTGGKKQGNWKKISSQIKRLQEINKELIRENQILQHKLFCQKSQKRHLKKMIESCNMSIQSEIILTPDQSTDYQRKKQVLTPIKLGDSNIKEKLYLTRVNTTNRKEIASKQNAFYLDKNQKQKSVNGSFITKKNQKYVLPTNNDPNYTETDLNLSTSQCNTKERQQDISFKDYESPKEKNQSLLLDSEPDLGNSYHQIKNKDVALLQKQSRQDKKRLQDLQNQFNELIGISRLEKNKERKIQIRKQLSQIAHEIHILKNKVPIW